MPEVEVRELQPQTTVVVRRRMTPAEMGEAMGELIGLVFQRAASAGAGPVGGPFCRYFGEMDGTFDMEVGVPVNKELAPEGETRPGTLPGGKVAYARHVGPFDQVGRTYELLEGWIRDNGYEAAGDPWEVYLTDPTTEPDPAKYQTDVFWPVSRA
jgi:effector-binding domain-containing protein